MRKSFQNGSGDERVGLSSSASGIDALRTFGLKICWDVNKGSLRFVLYGRTKTDAHFHFMLYIVC